MSLKDLRGRIAIVGVGTAGCGEAHGMSDLEILAQGAKTAAVNGNGSAASSQSTSVLATADAL